MKWVLAKLLTAEGRLRNPLGFCSAEIQLLTVNIVYILRQCSLDGMLRMTVSDR